MSAIFRFLDWHGAGWWAPYVLVLTVLLGVWAFLYLLFLSLIPPGGLI